MESKDRIIVALDVDAKIAFVLVKRLKDRVGCFKFGIDLMNAGLTTKDLKDEGILKKGGPKIFWDAKLNELPRKVETAVVALQNDGVDYITVMAAGGCDMMFAATDIAFSTEIVAVTVPTWLGPENVFLTFGTSSRAKVLQFAKDAVLCGVDFLVCSPNEVEFLRSRQEVSHLTIMTPGIRLPGDDPGDQKRLNTPYNAIKAGADFLVIGSSIYDAEDPVQAVNEFAKEIEKGLDDRED